MGMFSWIDCNNKNNITDNDKEVILLLPNKTEEDKKKKKELEEFLMIGEQDEKGIKGLYNGYGCIDGVDVYNVIVFYNILASSDKDFEKVLKINKRKDKEFCKSEDLKELRRIYQEAYKNDKVLNYSALITQFIYNHEFVNNYPDEIRDFGISIGCYDDQNAFLPVPIKMTYDNNLTYENAEFSMSDPEQGFFFYDYERTELDGEEWNGKEHLEDILIDKNALITKRNKEVNKDVNKNDIER